MACLNIDKSKFEQLINLGLSNEEICDFFMVSSKGLNEWIREVYITDHPYMTLKKLRAIAKANFLAEQRMLARKNPTASIWIGKNAFGQVDDVNADKNDTEDLTPLSELLK